MVGTDALCEFLTVPLPYCSSCSLFGFQLRPCEGEGGVLVQLALLLIPSVTVAVSWVVVVSRLSSSGCLFIFFSALFFTVLSLGVLVGGWCSILLAHRCLQS